MEEKTLAELRKLADSGSLLKKRLEDQAESAQRTEEQLRRVAEELAALKEKSSLQQQDKGKQTQSRAQEPLARALIRRQSR
jgi:hypothetical protein